MCSGIDALFGEEERSTVVYSAIHHRKLERDGPWILANVANQTGCDPLAALDMTPSPH